LTGAGEWSGIAIVNPENSDVSATIRLMAADGTVRAEQVVTIGAKGRYKAVVQDLFQGLTLNPDDYVRVECAVPLTGVVATGDIGRTIMKAITAN